MMDSMDVITEEVRKTSPARVPYVAAVVAVFGFVFLLSDGLDAAGRAPEGWVVLLLLGGLSALALVSVWVVQRFRGRAGDRRPPPGRDYRPR